MFQTIQITITKSHLIHNHEETLQPVSMVLYLENIPVREVYRCIAVFLEPTGTPVMIDMAMGDYDMPQPCKIDVLCQEVPADLSRRSGIEQHRLPGKFTLVAMHRSHHVWSVNRKLGKKRQTGRQQNSSFVF